MAKPTVSTYNSNGKVCTGRQNSHGNYTYLWSKMYYTEDGEIIAGRATAGGASYFPYALYLVVTWSDYPTGLFYTVFDYSPGGGYIDDSGMETPAAIKASYDDGWVHSSPILSPPYPDYLRGVEYRYYCCLWEYDDVANNIKYALHYMSEGTGTTLITGLRTEYVPTVGQTITGELEVSIQISSHERVDIQQTGWSWPENTKKCGIGNTVAYFDDVADEPSSGWVSNGILANGSYYKRQPISGYAFDTHTSWSMSCGGWGNTDIAGVTYEGAGGLCLGNHDTYFRYVTGGNLSSQQLLAKAKVGTTDCNLRLGYDGSVAYSFTGESGTVKGVGSGDTIYFYAQSTNAGTVTASWTDMGISLKYAGSSVRMDGNAPRELIDPAYKDINGHQWQGDTSDLIVYSGNWVLSMDFLGDFGATHSPETFWDGVNSWSDNDPAPSSFGVTLLNAAVFGDSTDNRVMLQYPRNKKAVAWSAADSAIIDPMTTKSASGLGMGGWTGVNCTLTASGGTLVVTDVVAGAYIYRADFYTDNKWNPYHWGGRFVKVEATCTQSGTPKAFLGSLQVKRTGGVDTMTKTFTQFVDKSTYVLYDTCNPSVHGTDVAQSYFDLATPLDIEVQSDATLHCREKSDLPWAWGIGAFDYIAITDLEVGYDYTFTSLEIVYVDPGSTETVPHKYGKFAYINPENFDLVNVGEYRNWNDEVGTGAQRYWGRRVIGLYNGRYAFECPDILKTVPSLEADPVYANYSVKECLVDKTAFQPGDHYGLITLSNQIVWSDAWWDAVNSEYTSEDVLFCPEVVPMAFLDDVRVFGLGTTPHDENTDDNDFYVRPVYDTVHITPWFGDGSTSYTRTGYCVLRYVKRYNGRVNGLYYLDNKYPLEAYPLESNPHFDLEISSGHSDESVETDRVGYFRSRWHYDPVSITNTEYALHPRRWTRAIPGEVETVAGILAITKSNNTRRVYLLDDVDSKLVLRIYNLLSTQYISREVLATTPDSCQGIACLPGRTEALVVVYEISGTVYRIISTDEGQNWSAAVSIASGTKPTIGVGLDRCEVVGYVNSSGKGCTITKRGDGNWSSEVVIADADSIVLVEAPTSRQGLWVAVLEKSGTLNRYISSNSGRTWTSG